VSDGSDDKPKPSKQEKALAKVAGKKFEIYEELYRPLAKDRLENDRATTARKNEARGLVNADLRIANKGRTGRIAAQGLSRGLNLGDSRIAAEQSAADVAHRTVRGGAEAGAVRGVESRERGTQLAHIKLGHGLASQAQASMAQQAQSATSLAISSAQSDLNESEAFATGLGQFAGTAYGLGALDGLGATTTTTPTFKTPANPRRI
jgi:hypothetical protein